MMEVEESGRLGKLVFWVLGNEIKKTNE